MKRTKLIKHLLNNNCVLYREGANHSIYVNLKTGKKSALPRHNEFGDVFCNEICKQFDILKIK